LANARSIVLVNLTGGFCAMAVYGANAWVPSYFIRTFGWSAPLSGMLYGTVIIVCGVMGVIGGGALSDLAVSRGLVSGRPMVMAIACLCAAPFAAVTPVVAEPRLSLVLLVPLTLLSTIALGILPSAQQGMTPSRMRGLVSSLGVFMVNLIGLGLGPSLIALMTDHVFHDPAKLRYSLATLLPVMLFAAALCGFCSLRHYRDSVNRLSHD
jgi:MFS family permease